MTVELKITGTVETLHLESGDRIIVTLDERSMTADFIVELQARLAEHFPDHEVIVLANGLRIAREARS